jgi:hypothetical protein
VRSYLSLILTLLLGLPPGSPLWAQQAASARAKLNIVVVEGEGAVNGIRQLTHRTLTVRVENENQRPVAEAAVLFSLPDIGAGGLFRKGDHSVLIRTDKAGRASAKGFRANDTQGKFQIRVQASYRGESATASITQTNSLMAATGSHSRRLIVIVAAVAAAVAAGAYVAARGNGGTSSMPTITAGSPTVGVPK